MPDGSGNKRVKSGVLSGREVNMEQELLRQTIERCKKGESEAFVWLLNQYGGRLYGYFQRLTRSGVEAEDLVQEMFTKLIQSIRQYEPTGNFEAWLFRVAANLVRDKARKRKRSLKTISMFQRDRDGKESPISVADEAPGPAERMDLKDQIERVQAALDQLPELDREIIIRRHYSQMSFKELSEQYDLPVGTVLAKVHRGMQKLKGILEQHAYE